MTETDIPSAPTLSPVRRLLGVALLALSVLTLVAFIAGTWNPWHYVRLQQFLSNPFAGVVIVTLLVAVGYWLLSPVRSEAAQHRRYAMRWLLVAAFLLSLPCYGIFNGIFSLNTEELAHAPSGNRTVAFLTRGSDRDVRMWVGEGLTMRDAGSLGRPCGQVTARFIDENLVHISSVYGDFDIRLDPRTARPLNPVGPTCSG